jgi:hypothetical protein
LPVAHANALDMQQIAVAARDWTIPSSGVWFRRP